MLAILLARCINKPIAGLANKCDCMGTLEEGRKKGLCTFHQINLFTDYITIDFFF